jgi:predicted ester cyclase
MTTDPRRITMTATDLCEQLLDAANRHDIDALRSISGNERLAQSFQRMITAFPDVHLEQEWRMVAEPKLTAWQHITGTHLGPWRGLEPTGRPIDVRGSITFEIVDGAVTDFWLANDWLGIAMQLGVELALPAARV